MFTYATICQRNIFGKRIWKSEPELVAWAPEMPLCHCFFPCFFFISQIIFFRFEHMLHQDHLTDGHWCWPNLVKQKNVSIERVFVMELKWDKICWYQFWILMIQNRFPLKYIAGCESPDWSSMQIEYSVRVSNFDWIFY